MLESRQQDSRQRRCHTTLLKLQNNEGQAEGADAKQCSRRQVQGRLAGSKYKAALLTQ